MAIDTSKLQVSNEQLLKGITSTALTALEYFTKLDAKEDQIEVKALIDPISSGFKMLNSQGYNADVVSGMEESLELVKDASTNDDYDLYNTTLATVYEQGTMGLEAIKQRETMLTGFEEELDGMYDSLSALKGRTVDSLEVMDAVRNSKLAIAEKTHATNTGRITNRINNIISQQEAINLANKLDYDKGRDGLQIKLDQFGSEYQADVAEKLGFVQPALDPETGERIVLDEAGIIEGVRDYYIPDGIKLNSDDYESALTAFNTYQDKVLSRESSLIQASKKANDLKIIETMNEWGVAPSSSKQSHKFQAIMNEVFKDDPSEMNTSMLFMSEDDRHDVMSKVNEINALRVEYPEVITGLQTLDLNLKTKYNEILEGAMDKEQKLFDKSQEILDDKIASDILIRTNNVNEIINTWNIGKNKDYKIPNITIYSDVSKIKGTVEANKMLHTDVMDRLIYIDEEQFMNIDVSSQEPLIAAYKNAKNYNDKYRNMSILIKKYLNSDGSDKGIAEDVWVTKQYSEVFIALLQSMKELLKSSPALDATTIE